MKYLLLIFVALSSQAFAGELDGELMDVHYYSGYVPVQHMYAVHCQIASDFVSMTVQKGTSDPKTTVQHVVFTDAVKNVADARALIQDAAKSETLIETIGPTDGPTAIYVGIIPGKVVTQFVKLQTKGQAGLKNPAAGVDALVEFANKNCQFR